jgi:hypothetical protein
MNHRLHLGEQWQEARRRAETYLRAERGACGVRERALLASAFASARGQLRLDPDARPSALVMEALSGFLASTSRAGATPMSPPIQHSRMLPEPIEFPLHDWMRRILGLIRAR